ncbi:MAG: ABC transporter C-terminal domain-containing protein [Christensenellaceae bacterium]
MRTEKLPSSRARTRNTTPRPPQKRRRRRKKGRAPAAPKPKDGGYRTGRTRRRDEKAAADQTAQEEISALESEESDINAQLALPEIAADYARLSERCKRLEEVKSALDNLYEEYETLI